MRPGATICSAHRCLLPGAVTPEEMAQGQRVYAPSCWVLCGVWKIPTLTLTLGPHRLWLELRRAGRGPQVLLQVGPWLEQQGRGLQAGRLVYQQ